MHCGTEGNICRTFINVVYHKLTAERSFLERSTLDSSAILPQLDWLDYSSTFSYHLFHDHALKYAAVQLALVDVDDER